MTYNDQIHAFAPLPSGALPTEAELRRVAAQSRKRQMNLLLKSVRRVFKG
jgi:hypothetical protein